MRSGGSTIEGGPLDLPFAQMKGMAILDRALEPSLCLARKDAGLVLDAADVAATYLAGGRRSAVRVTRNGRYQHGIIAAWP